SLIDQGIRVNGVAPGPIWTPLIPSTFSREKVASFGGDSPMQRPGEPKELAPAYVYLASNDSSYVNGQIIHFHGGTIDNGYIKEQKRGRPSSNVRTAPRQAGVGQC